MQATIAPENLLPFNFIRSDDISKLSQIEDCSKELTEVITRLKNPLSCPQKDVRDRLLSQSSDLVALISNLANEAFSISEITATNQKISCVLTLTSEVALNALSMFQKLESNSAEKLNRLRKRLNKRALNIERHSLSVDLIQEALMTHPDKISRPKRVYQRKKEAGHRLNARNQAFITALEVRHKLAKDLLDQSHALNIKMIEIMKMVSPLLGETTQKDDEIEKLILSL